MTDAYKPAPTVPVAVKVARGAHEERIQKTYDAHLTFLETTEVYEKNNKRSKVASDIFFPFLMGGAALIADMCFLGRYRPSALFFTPEENTRRTQEILQYTQELEAVSHLENTTFIQQGVNGHITPTTKEIATKTLQEKLVAQQKQPETVPSTTPSAICFDLGFYILPAVYIAAKYFFHGRKAESALQRQEKLFHENQDLLEEVPSFHDTIKASELRPSINAFASRYGLPELPEKRSGIFGLFKS